MEHGPDEPAARSALSAVLRRGNGVADEGGWSRLFVLLPHSRLARGLRPLRKVHVTGRRGIHDTLVEPHATVRRVVRLPGHTAAGLLRVQAAVASGRRALATRV